MTAAGPTTLERVLAGFDRVLGCLSLLLLFLFLFNWIIPAPDSSPSARRLAAVGTPVLAAMTLLFFLCAREMHAGGRVRWYLQFLALAPIAYLVVYLVYLRQ